MSTRTEEGELKRFFEHLWRLGWTSGVERKYTDQEIIEQANIFNRGRACPIDQYRLLELARPVFNEKSRVKNKLRQEGDAERKEKKRQQGLAF